MPYGEWAVAGYDWEIAGCYVGDYVEMTPDPGLCYWA